jgi:hypothetical protein
MDRLVVQQSPLCWVIVVLALHLLDGRIRLSVQIVALQMRNLKTVLLV